ncbi:hypothetical protein JD844_002553 [Phrynosoma platyrhinos]|uniref:Uncharacterized protein n=1 Tax=Phrynosoma platyrhinos TaxID=52577 RepID=A0ABQ7TBN2_PHRPL|nr:hypothetical protein JD844_002553 [Phrynosoma platyrhinos]
MMASQVTAKQFSPLPTDSPHKMHQQQYEGLLKRMYMPFVRGPENRHLFPSFCNKYSSAFLKSSPFIPPEDKSYLLAPHREDVSVINPCSGFLSPRAGAEVKAYQQIPYGENIEIQRSDKDVQPQQGTPASHWRDHIAKRRPSLLLEDVTQDLQWNTRAVPDISFRAKIGGRTSPLKVIPGPRKMTECFSSPLFAFQMDTEVKPKDPSDAYRDEKAWKYMYTSTTQRLLEISGTDFKEDPSYYPTGQLIYQNEMMLEEMRRIREEMREDNLELKLEMKQKVKQEIKSEIMDMKQTLEKITVDMGKITNKIGKLERNVKQMESKMEGI